MAPIDIINKYIKILINNKKKGGYSSIGRAVVCGTVGSQFKSGYPPLKYFCFSSIKFFFSREAKAKRCIYHSRRQKKKIKQSAKER